MFTVPCQFPGCGEPAPLDDVPGGGDQSLKLCPAHNQLWHEDIAEFQREWDACSGNDD
jgi:hypothetical protein